MISHELAQKLKEAGFRQAGKGNVRYNGNDLNSKAYFPTLTELIEATGNERVVQAVIDREIIWIDSTSVARLWLALNKS